MQDIRTEIRKYIMDNFLMGGANQALGNSDSFMDGHILDSTGFLELVSHLDEAFGVQVADDEMIPENLDSLDNIAAFIERKRAS